MTKIKRLFITLLRLLSLGASIAATVVMVTSHQSTEVLNLPFNASYSHSPAFKFFVIAQAIASGYNLVILLVSSRCLLWHMVVILDVVIGMLLCSSVSAALTIAHVGKKGNSHAGWLPICGQVPEFCDHVTGALVAGIAAAILYLVLVLCSLYSVIHPLFSIKP